MFHLIDKSGKILESSNVRISSKNYDTIYKEFSDEEKLKIEQGYLYLDGEFHKSLESIEKEIEKINSDFDFKVSNYLSKYPKREQDTFAQKLSEAQRVLAGEESIYIEGKAKAIGVSPEEFATKIIAKNEEFTNLYLELENKKDLEIYALTQEYESIKAKELENSSEENIDEEPA